MADQKISQLTALTDPDLELDFIPIADGTTETKNINLLNLGVLTPKTSAGGGTAFIGGIVTGHNTLGDDSLTIQSAMTGPAFIAKGSQSLVVGSNSLATADKTYSFGRSNQVKAANSLAVGENIKVRETASSSNVVGRTCDISGNEAVVQGSSVNISATAGNCIAFGKTINISGDSDFSTAIGNDINISGGQSLAVGYKTDVLQANSSAVGRNVRINAVGVSEFGGWTSAGNREAAIRCTDDNIVATTVHTGAFSPLDGGTIAGDEDSSTLPRDMISIRRSGDEVMADINITGVVKTVSFGEATKLGTTTSQADRTSVGSAIQNVRADGANMVKSIRQMDQTTYNGLVSAGTVDANTVYIII